MTHSAELSNTDLEKRFDVVEDQELSAEDSSDNYSSTEIKNKTWRGQIWDTLDLPKDERWFYFKLDCTLLFVASAGVFLRYLDQTNLTNAFVSGMKEDLKLYGNQLNYANAAWSVGYIIGQIPSNLILARVKPHYWLPFLEITWSVLTFCTSSVQNTSGLYAIRFFIGLFEGGHFPGVMYITSSWYNKEMLSKRMAIIQFCTGAGPMFGGFLQAAAYNGLNGRDGRAGWRWVFIIDGIISLPIAISTIFLLPDLPRNQRPNVFFTQKEIEFAKRRVPSEANLIVRYRWKEIINWFSTWHIWAFSALFSLACCAALVSSALPYWFKSYNLPGKPLVFSVAEINVYPTPMYAIQIISTVVYAFISDNVLRGRRWIIVSILYFAFFPVILGLIFVPVHPANKGHRWALYYLCGLFSGSAAQTWTWVNEACLGEPIKRAFVSTMMNAVAYSFQAWIPIVFFPTQDQPFVTNGNIMGAVFTVSAGFLALAIAYLQSLKIKTGFCRSVPPPPEALLKQ